MECSHGRPCMATQEICRALVESDVNIKVVSTLRKGIKDKINLEDAPPGKGRIFSCADSWICHQDLMLFMNQDV